MSIEQEITSLIEDHLDTVYDLQDKSSLESIIRREVENEEGDVLDMVTTEVTSQVRDLSDEYELLTHDQYAAIQSRLNVLERSETTVKENQIDWIIPPNDMIAGYGTWKQLEDYIRASGADNAPMVVAMVMATVRNLIELKLVEKGANKNEQ
jgi:Na+-transporting NADH:ubiquinone oxidoreductase subunit NqrC